MNKALFLIFISFSTAALAMDVYAPPSSSETTHKITLDRKQLEFIQKLVTHDPASSQLSKGLFPMFVTMGVYRCGMAIVDHFTTGNISFDTTMAAIWFSSAYTAWRNWRIKTQWNNHKKNAFIRKGTLLLGSQAQYLRALLRSRPKQYDCEYCHQGCLRGLGRLHGRGRIEAIAKRREQCPHCRMRYFTEMLGLNQAACGDTEFVTETLEAIETAHKREV